MSTWIRYLLCLGLWWAKTSYLCTYRYSKTQLFTALSRCKFWSFIASVLFKGLFIQSYDFDSCAKWKRFWPARFKSLCFCFQQYYNHEVFILLKSNYVHSILVRTCLFNLYCKEKYQAHFFQNVLWLYLVYKVGSSSLSWQWWNLLVLCRQI